MIAPPDCAAIVLAAGRSERYGSDDKLTAPLSGQPLASHIAQTLSAILFSQHIAVVANPDVGALFSARGFELARIEAGKPQGASLLAGLAAVRHAEHALICLADMPFVTTDHLEVLLDAGGRSVVATEGPDYRGPPIVFPLSKRAILDGGLDQGARALLREATLVPASARTVADIDAVEDFERFG